MPTLSENGEMGRSAALLASAVAGPSVRGEEQKKRRPKHHGSFPRDQ